MDRQLAESFRIHAQDGVMAYAAFPTMRARVGFAEVLWQGKGPAGLVTSNAVVLIERLDSSIVGTLSRSPKPVCMRIPGARRYSVRPKDRGIPIEVRYSPFHSA